MSIATPQLDLSGNALSRCQQHKWIDLARLWSLRCLAGYDILTVGTVSVWNFCHCEVIVFKPTYLVVASMNQTYNLSTDVEFSLSL